MTNEGRIQVEEFPLPLKLAFIQYDEELEPFKKTPSITGWGRGSSQAPYGGGDERLF